MSTLNLFKKYKVIIKKKKPGLVKLHGHPRTSTGVTFRMAQSAGCVTMSGR